MNMTCDLCGGQVVPSGEGGVCSQCGLAYDAQWIRQRYVNPPMAPTEFIIPPAAPTKPSTPSKKRSFKWAGVVFALSGIGAFVAGWMVDEDPMFSLGLFGLCAAATLITIGIIAVFGKKD